MNRIPRELNPKDVVKHFPAMTDSIGTLANWHSQKRGPRFFRVSRKIVYRTSDIEAFLFKNPAMTIDAM